MSKFEDTLLAIFGVLALVATGFVFATADEMPLLVRIFVPLVGGFWAGHFVHAYEVSRDV